MEHCKDNLYSSGSAQDDGSDERNGIVAILIDQHAGKHGTMVPFLGKEANTVRIVANEKTGCEVLAISAIMEKGENSYKIVLRNPNLLILLQK